MKLDIGSGDTPQGEGWMTVDLHRPADFRTPCWRLPVIGGSVMSIYAGHLLEHLTDDELTKSLREWRRVLIPMGTLEVVVPHLSMVCRQYLAGGADADIAYRALFGQDGPGMRHVRGFEPDTLNDALTDAGFEGMLIEEFNDYGSPALRTLAVSP
jgi:predicted SAM-dependent methyltransferase